MIDVKMTPHINDWNIWRSNTGHVHLSGHVFDSDKFRDDTIINTSRVLNVKEDNLGYKITTRNTTYYCIKSEFNTYGFYSSKETSDILNAL